VSVHTQEEFLVELRTLRNSAEGRQPLLRERVRVENTLAKRAASGGSRATRVRAATRFDVRRCAAIVDLQAEVRAPAVNRRRAA
jgi:hypothetical protein